MLRISIISLCCLALVGCVTTSYQESKSVKSSKTIKVALYADEGTLPICITKSIEILSAQKDISIEKINSKEINEGKLNQYDVFLLPGGTASGERNSLGKTGHQEITDFTRNGKSIIATCAGAYLSTKSWNTKAPNLELINAEVYDLDNWARGEQTVECTVNSSAKLNGKVFKIHYENGPPLAPTDLKLPAYTSLAKYKTDLHAKDAPAGMMSGKDAIIAAPYGKGKVLLFSSHPELTPGLEPMLVNAVHWASHHPTTPEKITWEKVFGPSLP